MNMTLEQVIADCEEEISDCQIDLDGISKLLEEYPERKEAFAHEIDDYKKRMDYNRQLAEWLKELAERRKLPEIIRCKDCKHYHTDVCGSELGIGGMYENIIVAHDACDRWTKGMNCVEPEGFCFLAERNE